MIPWTIRLSAILYACALVRMIQRRTARGWWTAGCLLYLVHVAAAFHYAYGWSHATAVRETTRQTQALFGVDWGGGIWFNYLFTAMWTGDVLWWWVAPQGHAERPGWINKALHGYMAWMFINGAIVFPQNTAVRIAAATVAVALLLFALRARDTEPCRR